MNSGTGYLLGALTTSLLVAAVWSVSDPPVDRSEAPSTREADGLRSEMAELRRQIERAARSTDAARTRGDRQPVDVELLHQPEGPAGPAASFDREEEAALASTQLSVVWRLLRDPEAEEVAGILEELNQPPTSPSRLRLVEEAFDRLAALRERLPVDVEGTRSLRHQAVSLEKELAEGVGAGRDRLQRHLAEMNRALAEREPRLQQFLQQREAILAELRERLVAEVER